MYQEVSRGFTRSQEESRGFKRYTHVLNNKTWPHNLRVPKKILFFFILSIYCFSTKSCLCGYYDQLNFSLSSIQNVEHIYEFENRKLNLSNKII